MFVFNLPKGLKYAPVSYISTHKYSFTFGRAFCSHLKVTLLDYLSVAPFVSFF